MEANAHNNEYVVGNNPSAVPPPPPPGGVNRYPSSIHSVEKSEKKPGVVRSFFRTVFRGVFVLSLILNIYFLVLVGSDLQQQVYMEGQAHQKIALIDIDSQVDMQAAEEIRKKLLRAEQDETVYGVILVINSPGGYVPPSEMIHRYIRDFKQRSGKPVYVSIEQVGASGAYWIATSADKIYAQTNSVVGSIGVIYINMVLETALKEKLGIDPVILKSTRSPFKDHSSPFRQPTEEEKADVRRDLDAIHERFVQVVSDYRGISLDQAWTLADGDVHDGPESLELKLIDRVGFLEDAIADLADQLGLEEPQVVRYMRPPTLREIVTAGASAMSEDPLDIHRHIEEWAMQPKIVALWPGR